MTTGSRGGRLVGLTAPAKPDAALGAFQGSEHAHGKAAAGRLLIGQGDPVGDHN